MENLYSKLQIELAELSPPSGSQIQILDELPSHPQYQSIQFVPQNHLSREQILLVPSTQLFAVCEKLKQTCGFSFLMDIAVVDFPERPLRFEVVYYLASTIQGYHRLRLKTAVDASTGLSSLWEVWDSANWLERECYDLYGVAFIGHPDLRRILCHQDFVGHPMRKDYPADFIQSMQGDPIEHVHEADRQRLMEKYDEDLMWINIGPAHPATHGTLRFMAVVDGGERIREFDAEIGYLHRCFEKMCENHNYNQIIPYTDRLNYCSAPMNNNCFAATIEKMLGVEIPARATVIRMILDELSRIIDHYVCIGTNAVDLGALTGFFYMFNEREKVYSLFEKLCGARLTVSLTRIGGQGFDLPHGWMDDLKDVVDSIEKTHQEMEELLTKNRIFVNRTVGAGPISAADAISFALTGPCLRAAGVAQDLRRDAPYYFYGDVDFDVAIASKGDTYDRYLVRMEEVRQSIRILRWCMKNLPAGPVCLSDAKICLPPKSEVYGSIEGLMNHFMLVINGVQVPAGEMYHAQEGANGEVGFYVVSDGSGTPYRVKCRAPSFLAMASFGRMVKDGYLADAIAALGSINIIAGELDR